MRKTGFHPLGIASSRRREKCSPRRASAERLADHIARFCLTVLEHLPVEDEDAA